MLSVIRRVGVYLIDLYPELLVVFLTYKQIVVQFLKQFQLQVMQVQGIHSPRELEGLVVIVEIVLVLGRQ